MFWRGGPTPTADFNVNLLAASTLGGGRDRRRNYLRTPWGCVEQSAYESGLEGVDGQDFDRHLDAVWSRLGVDQLLGPGTARISEARGGGVELVVQARQEATRHAIRPSRPATSGRQGTIRAPSAMVQTYLRDAVAAAPG